MSPAPGTPAPGTPASGTPASGTPAPGTPAPGNSASGTLASRTPAHGTTAPAPVAPGGGAAPAGPGGSRLARRDGGPGGLARAAAGPVLCALVLLGLLSAWAASGGAGTLSKVRIQVVSAAVPMRAFTPEAADAVTTAQAFLAIRNLSGRPDELIAVSSPIARRVVLTRRAVPGGAASVVSSLVIPAGRTIALSPLSDGVVLQDPSPFEASGQVPLTLVFRDAGAITIEAPVTGPGTP